MTLVQSFLKYLKKSGGLHDERAYLSICNRLVQTLLFLEVYKKIKGKDRNFNATFQPLIWQTVLQADLFGKIFCLFPWYLNM